MLFLIGEYLLVASHNVSGRTRRFVTMCRTREATKHATQPLELDDGVKLGYLEDGDVVVLSAWCEDASGRRVLGFGECRGQLVGPDAPIS